LLTKKAPNLDSSVKRTARKRVVVFRVDNDLHHVVSVTLEHLRANPLLLPIPQLYQHVIWHQTTQMTTCNLLGVYWIVVLDYSAEYK